VIGGGAGEPLLLLLHGLGATADVWEGWRPLLAERWPGRWVAPDLAGLLAASQARVLLARGETDPMVGAGQLAALRPDSVTLPGLGHSAHVQDPAAVLALLVS
jgi:pimeloyl-ACP methyl ester carboxylesterase